jgi:hypothetical protein
MVAFGHTAVGATVGLAGYALFSTLPPYIGLPLTGALGVASHYLADLLPHGHFFRLKPKDFKKEITITIFFDVLLGVALFLGIAYFKSGFDLKFWHLFFGIGGAQFPDVLANLINLKLLPNKGLLKKEGDMHLSTHWHGKFDDALRISFWDLWQLAVVFLSVLMVAAS